MSAAVKTNVVPLPKRATQREDDFTKPYVAREEEHTKPYVSIPLDWIGEDEVTVRWETVRRELPPAYTAQLDAPAPPQRGIGPRGAGLALGVVLGIAISIGSFALLLGSEGELPARTAQAAVLPERGAGATSPAPMAVPEIARFEPASVVPAGPAVRPEPPPKVASAVPGRPQIVPLGQARPEASAQSRLARPLLNVDATQRAHVIL
ncbi:MAG TPA: hypothetical protein VGK73_01660, partial [Polyangiaceae bacterium]